MAISDPEMSMYVYYSFGTACQLLRTIWRTVIEDFKRIVERMAEFSLASSRLKRSSTAKQHDSTSLDSEGVGDAADSPRTPRACRKKTRLLQGWRFGVAVWSCVAFTVFITNTLITIVAIILFPPKGGIGTIYEGSCQVVDTSTTVIHVFINALSTILLSGSNYTMQCLCSPTRKELDHAHVKADWLEIGVVSVRNVMGRISRTRAITWWMLGASSVPIHLLYNSAVFKSTDANIYSVALANQHFLEGKNLNPEFVVVAQPGTPGLSFGMRNSTDNQKAFQFQQFFANYSTESDQVEKLSNAECIAQYGSDFVSGRSDVLLVTNETGLDASNNLFFWADNISFKSTGFPYAWICMNQSTFRKRMSPLQNLKWGWWALNPHQNQYPWENCDVQSSKANATNWTISDMKIDHCLSKITPTGCKLQFSVQILAVVIVCNIFKTIAMLWTVCWQRDRTLVTFGDAVADYLEHRDYVTAGRCLLEQLNGHPFYWATPMGGPINPNPPPKIFEQNIGKRWFTAVSGKRWFTLFYFCSLALLITSIILIFAATGLSTLPGNHSPLSLGFGAINVRAVVTVTNGLLSSVTIANLPQIVASFLYLTYNGAFTAMLQSAEWDGYFLRPKPLRVTTPYGQQRSTYWLHLPYRYSIPLLFASGILHWLISESIFLARIEMWNGDQKVSTSNQIGYSCLPVLFAICMSLLLLAVIIGFGMRRFRSPMPVLAACSALIANACHRPCEDIDAAFLPVSWGELTSQRFEETGHCCFTSKNVQDLIDGRIYQ